MWPFHRSDRACRAFEARLEDYLESLGCAPAARPDPALAAHLAACSACREALDLASQAGPLLREGASPLPESLASDPYFAVRVTARIRERAARSGEFLPQLQTVSLRVMAYAMSLAVLLGALSAAGVTRAQRPTAAHLRPAGLRAVSPEVNPAPANPDDVVIALLTSERGRQPR
jgi:predicted anti-sigma-YlaC factor YlaD